MNKHIFIILAFLSFISLRAQQLETYDVKEGETLTGIAQKFKVTSDQILEYNPDLSRKGNIKPQTIFITNENVLC